MQCYVHVNHICGCRRCTCQPHMWMSPSSHTFVVDRHLSGYRHHSRPPFCSRHRAMKPPPGKQQQPTESQRLLSVPVGTSWLTFTLPSILATSVSSPSSITAFHDVELPNEVCYQNQLNYHILDPAFGSLCTSTLLAVNNVGRK